MTTPEDPGARSASSPSGQEHRDAAPRSVGCAILTVSDTRTEETDASGALLRELLSAAGHAIVRYRIVPDDPALIASVLEDWVADAAVQAVLTNGGTGIAGRDNTYEAIDAMLDKRIDGFGELFRMLSYEDIGPAAMLSRAVGGIRGETVILAMPGSSNAVRLAAERLILPEIGHLVYETTK